VRGLVVGWAARGAGFAVGVGIVAGIALLAMEAIQVVALAFLAILFASALEPVVGWLRARLPLGRSITILLVYAGFFTLVAGFAVLILPTAFSQAETAANRIPLLLDEIDAWAMNIRPEAAGESVTAVTSAARRVLGPSAPPDPDEVLEVGLTVAEVLTYFGTMLALVFFWLVGHARLQRYALAFLPLHRRAGIRETWNEVETRLGLWARGQLLLMTIVGVSTGVAYFLLGVPSALLLGVIAGLFEAIPIVGPILGAIPAVLFAATVGPELVLGVLAVTVVVQVVENNVLVPAVMRNTIGLSPFVVTISLLFGAVLGGILGALVAVPLAAAAMVVLERLQAREAPIAQDPAGERAPDRATSEAFGQSLPDARTGAPDLKGPT
jgi:predicted PurR-regulated permease PerM